MRDLRRELFPALRFPQERGLVTEDVRNHQFRFKDVVDPESNRNVFLLEHEVRSITIRCFIV